MLYSRLRTLPGYGNADTEHQQIWRILSSKLVKLLATTVVAILVAVFWIRGFRFTSFYNGSLVPAHGALTQDYSSFDPDDLHPGVRGKGRLHLLIPATSTNPELCKLLLSAQILGYPTPVLINYGDKESEDGYVQHLAKVEGILRYLEKLESSDDYLEDLVLIIDGYDIWFQLRPDVLIKRFYAINAAANVRTIARYGEELFAAREMYQSVLFGPDKLCWPVDFSRPACWAVPDTTIPDDAFGPVYDHEARDKNPAKWLNSGTVMGNTKDLKDIFNATLEAINSNHVTDSDQFYFANVWGEQEFARLSTRPDLLEKAKNKIYYDHEDPNNNKLVRAEPVNFGKRTEYHIGIDYDSTMFQTLAFWKGQLAWTRVVDSWSPQENAHFMPDKPWEFKLDEDILASRPPFDSLDADFHATNRTLPGWESVELAYNVLTHQHPVLLHVTGHPEEKKFRKYWWTRMWFQNKAEKLRAATHRLDEKLITQEPIANMLWYNAEHLEDAEEIADGGKGGAWTDRRGWLSWKGLCKAAEGELYLPGDDEYYHPSPDHVDKTSPPPVDPITNDAALLSSQWEAELLPEEQVPRTQAGEQAEPVRKQRAPTAVAPAEAPAALGLPPRRAAEMAVQAKQGHQPPQVARAAKRPAIVGKHHRPAQPAAW